MSTNFSPSKISTKTRSPAFTVPSPSPSLSRGTSRMNFTGGRLFFARWPCAGLVIFDCELMLRHHARASLQHRDRANIALGVKQLRHADLLAQNTCNFNRHLNLHSQLGSPIALAAIGWGAPMLVGEQPPSAVQRAPAREHTIYVPCRML